jgi:hypothetical protein
LSSAPKTVRLRADKPLRGPVLSFYAMLQDLLKAIANPLKSSCSVCGCEMNFLKLLFWLDGKPEKNWPIFVPFCPACEPGTHLSPTIQ